MLFITAMVWWIIISQKMDLDEKIRRMTACLAKRYGGVEVEEESESYLGDFEIR